MKETTYFEWLAYLMLLVQEILFLLARSNLFQVVVFRSGFSMFFFFLFFCSFHGELGFWHVWLVRTCIFCISLSDRSHSQLTSFVKVSLLVLSLWLLTNESGFMISHEGHLSANSTGLPLPLTEVGKGVPSERKILQLSVWV